MEYKLPVLWDSSEEKYYIKHKMSNGQTIYMEFSRYDKTNDTQYWNVALAVYSKRKHAVANENNIVTTGKSPFETFILARKMFLKIENEILTSHNGHTMNNIIIVHWVDNRRRDAYYRVLKKYGYQFGIIGGYKVIYKRYEKQCDRIEYSYDN